MGYDSQTRRNGQSLKKDGPAQEVNRPDWSGIQDCAEL